MGYIFIKNIDNRNKNVTIGADMYNKRQELILDFIKDNPTSKRDDIELFLTKMGYDI